MVHAYAEENRIAKRQKKIAKIAAYFVVIAVPLIVGIIGFFIGRATAPAAAPLPIIAAEQQTYTPDPCGLTVVVCEGEAGY